MFHGSNGRWTAVFLLISTLALCWVIRGVRAVRWQGPTQSWGGQSAGGAASSPDAFEAQLPDDIATIAPMTPPPAPSYDFSQPVPQGEAVDKSYFDDAAFVGDSRTDGFLIYSGIGRGKNLTSNGLSIFQLGEKKALTIEGEKYTLLEALAQEQYGKVYLSLGVNELGHYDDEGFYLSYCQAIDEIRRIQPSAVIYIQGLIPINETGIAESKGNTALTNEHLRVYNQLMFQAAQEKQVAFLDLYTEFVDENQELPSDASRDGVHLHRDWCKQWLTYLQTHVAEYQDLYPDGPPTQAAEELPEEPATDRSVV